MTTIPWLHWMLISFFVLESIGYVLRVGVPRKPIDSSLAAGEVFFYTVLVLALVFFK